MIEYPSLEEAFLLLKDTKLASMTVIFEPTGSFTMYAIVPILFNDDQIEMEFHGYDWGDEPYHAAGMDWADKVAAYVINHDVDPTTVDAHYIPFCFGDFIVLNGECLTVGEYLVSKHLAEND